MKICVTSCNTKLNETVTLHSRFICQGYVVMGLSALIYRFDKLMDVGIYVYMSELSEFVNLFRETSKE